MKRDDFVYPIFMLSEVPHVLRGFLIVAILSAAMSSVSSALTSLASVSTMDFVKPLTRRRRSEEFFLKFSRYSTVAWAAALIVIAYLSREVAFVLNAAFSLRGLTSGVTYYFAVRLADEAGNWSDVSNIVRWDWSLDADAPSAPQGLTAKRTGGTVHLAWTANTESDLAGYNVYRATSAGGPFTRINPSLVTGPIYDDSSLPASDLLWYAVTALDHVVYMQMPESELLVSE